VTSQPIPQPIPQPVPQPPSPPTVPEPPRDREVPAPAASAPGETAAPPPRTRRSLESLLDAAGRGTKAPRAGASMTAMIVGASIFGAGVVVGTLVLRSLISGSNTPTASPSGPEPSPPTAPPPTAVASRAGATTGTVPAASAAPPTSVSASARTSPEPAPSASAESADPAKLPADEGYLFVEARPIGAFVYVDGAKTGPTSRNLRVRCGDLHVRLGIMRPGRMTWLSGSRSVQVACRAVTTVEIPISQNPSPAPTRPGWVPHGI
ncbi:MAG: hypothetical protein HY908_13510, partial [Myxococcales bacterium]|nr:hypothetical protein [Myxococcales bacterium]